MSSYHGLFGLLNNIKNNAEIWDEFGGEQNNAYLCTR